MALANLRCMNVLNNNNYNDILWRAIKRAQMPAVKEPINLMRDDNKRPDGTTLLPWACLSVYLFVCIQLEKLRTGFREVGRSINFRYDMIYMMRHGGVHGEKSGGNVGGGFGQHHIVDILSS